MFLKKYHFFYFLVIFALIFVWSGRSGDFAYVLAQAPVPVTSDYYLAGELLLRFKDSGQLVKLEFAPEVDLSTIIAEYRVAYGDRLSIGRNFRYQTTAVEPNDADYERQWYLEQVRMPEAWEYTTGSSDIIIAVMDTGLDLDHPDIVDNLWNNKNEIAGDGLDNDNNGYVDDVYGWDFIEDDNDPTPTLSYGYNTEGVSHGTVVAGIAAAQGNNLIGISGVSWNSKIMPLKVLDNQGNGTSEGVIRAINYAIAQGVDIINFSFVGVAYDDVLREAVLDAYDAGLVMTAAAGNGSGQILGVGEGGSLDFVPQYPICFHGYKGENIILGVAATDTLDQKAFFSNFGTDCVDVSAPGVGMYSTQMYEAGTSGLDYYYSDIWSGTSMATPMVSGLAALLKSMDENLTVDEIISLIMNNTIEMTLFKPFQGKMGTGRIDAYKTLAAAQVLIESGVLAEEAEETAVIEVEIIGSTAETAEANSKGGMATREVTIIKDPGSQTSSETAAVPQVRTVVGAGSGRAPEVKIFNPDTTLWHSFLAFEESFTGGVNVAGGNITGMNDWEVIVTPAGEWAPYVLIYDQEGFLYDNFLAYEEDFMGGVNVALGDVTGDGQLEIITAPAWAYAPLVKIFQADGSFVASFYAYEEDFTGGVTVATGDIDGDGIYEIITGPGRNGGPQVRVFDSAGNLKTRFFAYEEDFTGGVYVATGDFDGNGTAEIITGPGRNGGPQVRVFSAAGEVLGQFFAYDEAFHGGIRVATGDWDSNGVDEIIVGTTSAGGPQVRVFDSHSYPRTQFFAFEESFHGGVFVTRHLDF